MASEKSNTRRAMELHQAGENQADGTLADLAMGPALVSNSRQIRLSRAGEAYDKEARGLKSGTAAQTLSFAPEPAAYCRHPQASQWGTLLETGVGRVRCTPLRLGFCSG